GLPVLHRYGRQGSRASPRRSVPWHHSRLFRRPSGKPVPAAGGLSSSLVLPDGIDDALGALVVEVTVHDEQGMYDTRHPEQQGQKNIENALHGLAAEEHRQWWQQYGDQIAHVCG